MPARRTFLIASLLAARSGAFAAGSTPSGPLPLRFPAGYGAHAASHVEWWYITGALEAAARTWGFQITFFRVPTNLAGGEGSRFAAREIVFAHAAVTDLEQGRLRHDQRIGRVGFGVAEAAAGDTGLVLRDWRLGRSDAAGKSRYAASAASESAGFAFELVLDATQPLLLQGVDGFSQKGPRSEQSSRYYSEPQLAVRGTLALDGVRSAVTGRAWLDHEWSDSYLDAGAVGWDWLGVNLDDGAALMAFRIRRPDGTALWSGGSFRSAAGERRNFADGEVVLTPGRTWTSPSSRARYPVQWQVDSPAGRFQVRALQDDQELDSRASTGAIYWEGLSLLLDPNGRRLGRGYLEMTGYAERLVL